jgi:hypothetical protein
MSAAKPSDSTLAGFRLALAAASGSDAAFEDLVQTEYPMFKKLYLFGLATALATAVACGSGDKGNPVSPSAGGTVGAGDAGADGETLKVTAPGPQAPANGSTLDTFTPTLRVTAAAFRFQGSGRITHRFQLLNGSTVLREFSTAGTTWVPQNLENKTTYGWRARGEQGSFYGPWSATWTFTTPDQPEGYNRPGELYDPLIDGKTVGDIQGAVTFIPGVGAKLENFTSHIRYRLPQTVDQGEFSILVTGVPDNTEGGKTKLMAMSEGLADLITNDRRFTLERRGNPKGVIAWRMISHRDQIDTVGNAQRKYVRFSANQVYLVRAVWRSQFLNITINEGGASGKEIYRMGKPYNGAYDPNPHYAFAGAPIGRSGVEAATVPGMIVRQLWLSVNPRPAFANK